MASASQNLHTPPPVEDPDALPSDMSTQLLFSRPVQCNRLLVVGLGGFALLAGIAFLSVSSFPHQEGVAPPANVAAPSQNVVGLAGGGIDFATAYLGGPKETGRYTADKLNEMIEDLGHLLVDKHTTAVWIGITSNGEDGCRDRWNQKYKGYGMKHMAWLYQPNSNDERQTAEHNLINWFHTHKKSQNVKLAKDTGAGGKAPWVVYVAWN